MKNVYRVTMTTDKKITGTNFTSPEYVNADSESEVMEILEATFVRENESVTYEIENLGRLEDNNYFKDNGTTTLVKTYGAKPVLTFDELITD